MILFYFLKQGIDDPFDQIPIIHLDIYKYLQICNTVKQMCVKATKKITINAVNKKTLTDFKYIHYLVFYNMHFYKIGETLGGKVVK